MIQSGKISALFDTIDLQSQEQPRESGEQPMSHQSKELDTLSTELRFEKDLLALVNAIHAATDNNAIMLGLREQILDAYQVEMATIFLVDIRRKHLASWLLLPGEFLKRIELPINRKSVCGYVARTRETVNIQDVYDKEELKNIDQALTFLHPGTRKQIHGRSSSLPPPLPTKTLSWVSSS